MTPGLPKRSNLDNKKWIIKRKFEKNKESDTISNKNQN